MPFSEYTLCIKLTDALFYFFSEKFQNLIATLLVTIERCYLFVIIWHSIIYYMQHERQIQSQLAG